jgi:predicted nucleic acid-binding protein
VTLDTSFLILHYFSKDLDVLRKSRSVLHFCRLAGNSGIVPTVVLAEFYAIARRDAGRDAAELRLKELVDSGLELVQLSPEAARESGVIRAKYNEKIPWGDCFIAGTHISKEADVVLSEDPHFRDIKEIRTRKLAEFKV